MKIHIHFSIPQRVKNRVDLESGCIPGEYAHQEPACLTGVKTGCVHLCQVAGYTVIGCLHDPANVQHYICWKFAGCLLDRVNTP